MTDSDLKEREEIRQMIIKLHLVVIGDEAQGIDGMMHRQKQTLERIEGIEEKLKKDHELLWWNRTADGIWVIIKRPILYLITFAVIAAVAGGSGIGRGWDYILMKVGVR